MKLRARILLGAVAAMGFAFNSQVASADTVLDSGTVYLQAYVGAGSSPDPTQVVVRGGGGGGGEFLFKRTGGLGTVVAAYTTTDTNYFKTFCIEENEFISQGSTYTAEVSGAKLIAGRSFQGGRTAHNLIVTGSGPSATFSYDTTGFSTDLTLGPGGVVRGAPSVDAGKYDAIDLRTAYLFQKYIGGGLTTFAPGGTPLQYTNAQADAEQEAIWALEGENNSGLVLSSLAHDLIMEANAAVTSGAWVNYGDVRVLNLYDPTSHALMQSQLVLDTANASVPLPGVAMMGLVSLDGLFGFRAYRGRLA